MNQSVAAGGMVFSVWCEWMARGALLRGDLVGWEVERIVCDRAGTPMPIVHLLMPYLGSESGKEPAAWQLEVRTKPCETVAALKRDMQTACAKQDAVAARYGATLQAIPVVYGGDPPIEIYPDEEYRQCAAFIEARAGKEGRKAARAVAGFQINIGCTGAKQCLRRYNRLVAVLGKLIPASDRTGGKRLSLYRKASPNCAPRRFETLRDFYRLLQTRGLLHDPARLHTMIQIKPGWVIELRFPDTTDDLEDMARLTNMALAFAGD